MRTVLSLHFSLVTDGFTIARLRSKPDTNAQFAWFGGWGVQGLIYYIITSEQLIPPSSKSQFPRYINGMQVCIIPQG
jgi:hypothetical protein